MHDGILQIHAGIGHADHADMMPSGGGTGGGLRGL